MAYKGNTNMAKRFMVLGTDYMNGYEPSPATSVARDIEVFGFYDSFNEALEILKQRVRHAYQENVKDYYDKFENLSERQLFSNYKEGKDDVDAFIHFENDKKEKVEWIFSIVDPACVMVPIFVPRMFIKIMPIEIE